MRGNVEHFGRGKRGGGHWGEKVQYVEGRILRGREHRPQPLSLALLTVLGTVSTTVSMPFLVEMLSVCSTGDIAPKAYLSIATKYCLCKERRLLVGLQRDRRAAMSLTEATLLKRVYCCHIMLPSNLHCSYCISRHFVRDAIMSM